MRVDVFINSRAGFVNADVIEKKVRRALFRCDLHFHRPATVADFQGVLLSSGARCEAVIICGGDGTLNTALQPLMALREQGKTPIVCLIPLGTANDLATEMGLSKKIDTAARALIEGSPRSIDVLEIESQGKCTYMITNGGIGLPAITARRANVLRTRLSQKIERAHGAWALALWATEKVMKRAGSKIYEFLLFDDLTKWNRANWEVQISANGQDPITTSARFIMINNQPGVGGKFRPAPFTSNNDGTFNVLIIQPQSLVDELHAIWTIRSGKLPDAKICPSFETSEIKIVSTESSRPVTFFGDGEILQRNSRELQIRCLHPGLRFISHDDELVL